MQRPAVLPAPPYAIPNCATDAPPAARGGPPVAGDTLFAGHEAQLAGHDGSSAARRAPPAAHRGPTAGSAAAAEFAQLKARVVRAGLLEKRPGAYVWRFAGVALGLAGCVAMLVLAKGVGAQLANGALLAFLYAHIGFLMHDAGHRQIFRSAAGNTLTGFVCANLLVGLSLTWWMDKHNRHHANPNDLDADPDVDFPVLAFSEEQALSKPAPWRLIVRYQAVMFFPLLLLEGLSLRAGTIMHLLRGGSRRPWLEAGLLAAHYGLYFGIVFGLLRVGPALAFIAAHQALAGLYSGLVFAPNHKGMPLVERGNRTSFLEQQVLTSRNVRPSPLVDFLYGGLNYQIEHHLFPVLARHQLAPVRKIVREFCGEHGLAYYETGVIQSLREVLSYLHRVSAPLRGGLRSRRRLASDAARVDVAAPPGAAEATRGGRP